MSLTQSVCQSIAFTVINKYGEGSAMQISTMFGAFTMLLSEGSVETGVFRH